MKLSFMTFACPDWTVEEIVVGARRYGYEGVELRVQAEHRHQIEVSTNAAERRSAARRFSEAGIEIACLATSLCFARSGQAGRAVREATLPLLDLAADLSTPGLRVFGGEPVRDEENSPEYAGNSNIERDDAVRWAVDNLQSVAGEAAARGVGLWFETHDYFPLGRHAAAVVRGVNHPSVRCNWDVMHPQVNGEDFAQTKEELSGLIAHTHFHDAKSADPMTICAFGEGDLPLPAMLRWLRDEEGYTGYLSAEYFGDSLGAGPDVSLPLWANGCRRLLEQIEEIPDKTTA